MYQTTYHISRALTNATRRRILDSKMALIHDCSLGWFDIPESFLNEFKETFPDVPLSAYDPKGCFASISKDDIEQSNREKYPEAYFVYKSN